MPHCMTFYRRVLCVCHVCLHCCTCMELYMYVPVQVCVCRHTCSGQRSTPCFHPQSPATLIFETLMIPWDPPFFCLPTAGVTSTLHHILFLLLFFYLGTGDQTQVLALVWQGLERPNPLPSTPRSTFWHLSGLAYVQVHSS